VPSLTPSVDLRKLALVLVVLTGMGLFFGLDLGRFFGLKFIQDSLGTLVAARAAHPVQASLLFVVVYVGVTALSLPGAAILTLAGGALFGLVWGTLLVSVASTLGATLAMVTARYLLRDLVQARFGHRLTTLNQGIARDGAFYLFTLRLIPAMPFFVLNLLAGLTHMKIWTFAWVSQLGMLAATLVFVNAGTEIARIDSLASILSPSLIGSFVLLGLLPLMVRRVIAIVRRRKVYARWKTLRPKALRPQPRRHRRGRRRPRHRLHRRSGEGEGHARRGPQDGRRLPQLRLRAQQGADQDGQAGAPDAPRRALRTVGLRTRVQLPVRDAAHPRGDCRDRAA
jgi:uncharacterized membrane protein YdjX (TVP38/TMEM64 family)